MKVSISRSSVNGEIIVPPSKSYTIRSLICAALARGESLILNPLLSDDTLASLSVLDKVGVDIKQQKNRWIVKGGNFHQPDSELYCMESAATLRFMTAICSLITGKSVLTAGPSLSRRPVGPLIDALRQWGIDCTCKNGYPPVTVFGGQHKGGIVEIPGNISSQFISALLLIAPRAEKDTEIKITTPVESTPYILMTINCMEQFGVKVGYSMNFSEFKVVPQSYQPANFIVEGDWSSASYLLALGAVAGNMKIFNLNTRSLQGDKIIVDFLKKMGAEITFGQDFILVNKSYLKAINVDLSDYTDLLPTMAVLSAVAEGKSELSGIKRARIKESDRVSAVKEGLQKLGIKVREKKDSLVITGGKPKGTFIESKNDHRIAMAFSILGTICDNLVINDAECVSKTFPQYWGILKNTGVEVKIHE